MSDGFGKNRPVPGARLAGGAWYGIFTPQGMGLIQLTLNISNDQSQVINYLETIIKTLKTMPTKADFEAAFTEINEATNNIADDITRLTEQLGSGGLSEADETAVLDELKATAEKLKGIAATTPEA